MVKAIELTNRLTEVQKEYTRLAKIQADKTKRSRLLEIFINEIKNTNKLNLTFNKRLFNLTIEKIIAFKNHLEFNFKDGSIINIEF